MSRKRTPVLVAIVFYKSLLASLMLTAAIAAFFTLKNHQSLEQFTDLYLLESKHQLIDWILSKILQIQPTTLKFGGIFALFYAAITAIEAVGLWHQKAWAEFLVAVLVASSIPLELLEIFEGINLLKIVLLIINIAVLSYLAQRLRSAP